MHQSDSALPLTACALSILFFMLALACLTAMDWNPTFGRSRIVSATSRTIGLTGQQLQGTAPHASSAVSADRLTSMARAEPILPTSPTLPRVTVDVSMPDTTGYTVVRVNAGGSLQKAIDNASCSPNGTIIRIQAGAIFEAGPSGVILRNKTCATGKWIIIRSDALDSMLPGMDERAQPSNAANMPTIVANVLNTPGIRVEQGASNYRLLFLQVRPSTNFDKIGSSASLIELGDGSIGGPQNTTASQPHHVIIDRCLLRGYDDPPVGLRRGVSMQCKNCAVVGSYINGIHQVGFDTQAICGWNSTGPWLIDNNYLEAAGENVMVGGATVTISDATPSDITITRNYFFKPLAWKVGDPSYAGTHWSVKNLLELKFAQRVVVEGNVFQNNWVDAQAGEALNLSDSPDGADQWVTLTDVTLRFNKIIHSEGGWGAVATNFGPSRCAAPPAGPARVLYRDNLGIDIGGGSGRYLLVLGNDKTCGTDGIVDLYYSHNTIITTAPVPPYSWFVAEATVQAGHRPFLRFGFHDNIVGTQGKGENVNCEVAGAAVSCFSSNSFFKNILYTHGCRTSSVYDHNGVCISPNDIMGVGFMNFSAGDYRLSANSPGHNAATDGRDVGADITTLNQKTVGTVTGLWPPASLGFGPHSVSHYEVSNGIY